MDGNDLISRGDAIRAVRHAWAKGLEPSQYIEIIPAVDAAPVRHGRWEPSGDDDFMCSACRERYFTPALRYSIYTGFDGIKLDRMAYCPNCGAKMDGGVKCEL